jgi:predicted dehydrogenase
MAAAAASLSACAHVKPTGANEDVRIGIMGFRSRGLDHIEGFSKVQGVRITALCDVDSTVMARQVDAFKKKNIQVETYTDIRKMLESKNVDVISVATPNHWHSLAAVWSVQAGKDVYLEKPVSHNVWEGGKVVEAARKYKKIVQAGMQCRSSTGLAEAVEWVKAGNLGKIIVARGLCYKPRTSIGKTTGDQAVPSSIDYDLWTGPAALVPPHRNGKFGPVHYDWHWFWNYGNGDLGNQGIHQVDICRWFLGEKALSPRVFSVGGRLGYEDDGETPNTQMVFHGYSTPMIFEVRGLPEKSGSNKMDNIRGASIGVIIECEGGCVVIPSYTEAYAYDKSDKLIRKFEGAKSHFQNFIDAVRSRKVSSLKGEIYEGHISSALCHTGNISYRLGATAAPGEVRERIKGDRDAAPTFDRMAAHLAANGVDIEKAPLTLGMVLKMNPGKAVFIDNDKANALLKREYRKPFVVPEKV